MDWNTLVKAGVAIVATAASFSAAAALPEGVSVSVSPLKQNHGKNDDVWVKVTMTNSSDKAQMVLKWRTPFAGEMEEALFQVTRDGEPVPYQGKHVKRPTPGPSDYFLLKPGQSYHAKVELSSLYDMTVTGDYQITYRIPSLTQESDGELKSATQAIYIDGMHPRGYKQPVAEVSPALTTGGVTFTNCSSTQKTTVTSSLNAAQTYAANSAAYLNAGTVGPRYTKWFGTYSSTRYNTVKSHFAAIKTAFDTKPITVDCGCNQNYYAYVYPTQPYKIYVCKAYWAAKMTGTDSKAGTMVHEMSHFNVVAGTDDHAYGQSAAASLAISNPGKAVDNADSHEYFAENTPALN
jgi:peptidyl-Lys metalloendopeptidase